MITLFTVRWTLGSGHGNIFKFRPQTHMDGLPFRHISPVTIRDGLVAPRGPMNRKVMNATALNYDKATQSGGV